MSKRHHIFNKFLASKVGVEKSILLRTIQCREKRSEENDINFIDGYYWGKFSYINLSDYHKYFNIKKLIELIHELSKDGLIYLCREDCMNFYCRTNNSEVKKLSKNTEFDRGTE